MVRIVFEGKEACFTRPELKVERVSYEVPTPSALRGMIEAIYWHPGIQWQIEKIYIINPIDMYTIKRNELNIKGTGVETPINARAHREPRSSRVLKNVKYVVEASFRMTNKANESDNPNKIQDIITRRVRKGQCFNTPYFGTREFPAIFYMAEDKDLVPADINKDFGLMLYDIDYTTPQSKPTYFHCIAKNGVIDLRNIEVLR